MSCRIAPLVAADTIDRFSYLSEQREHILPSEGVNCALDERLRGV